jgi:hypothetical protein
MWDIDKAKILAGSAPESVEYRIIGTYIAKALCGGGGYAPPV